MGGGQFSKASEPTRPQYNLTMVDSIAESARKASAGTWRKPRVRIYDYNQDIGSNYYQPMIKYINAKEVYGPYMDKGPIEMPERAEIGSNKYSNMRYNDKQIKELNSSTATAHHEILHNSKLPTFYTRNDLLGRYVRANGVQTHYLNELQWLAQQSPCVPLPIPHWTTSLPNTTPFDYSKEL